MPLVGAGPVGSTLDDTDLGGPEGVAVVFTGAEVEVGTTGAGVAVEVGADVCGTVVVVVVVVAAMVVVDVTLGVVVVVVSPGAAGSCPGPRTIGSFFWATMPVGAVTRRVMAHSTKREVALDNFMVERYSGASMWKVCRSETNRVVWERTGGKNIEGREERGGRFECDDGVGVDV